MRCNVRVLRSYVRYKPESNHFKVTIICQILLVDFFFCLTFYSIVFTFNIGKWNADKIQMMRHKYKWVFLTVSQN